MQIMMNDKIVAFLPWKPEFGRVFDSSFAFDSETTPIDEHCPWQTPDLVLAAASDGNRGFFILPGRIADFFQAHSNVPIIMHHAVFDLAVLQRTAPDLDIYGSVDANLVWDTQLLHRLYMLGTDGKTASKKGESTLETCVQEHLGVDLPKDVVDSAGDPVRTSYGKWLKRDPRHIEPIYLKYLAQDVLATHSLFEVLQGRIGSMLENSNDAWGYVSDSWLSEQVSRWGPQTHHIQLKASIVLGAITANGLCVDLVRRDQLMSTLTASCDQHAAELRDFGYTPGVGSQKKMQAILGDLATGHPEIDFPRTETGRYSSAADFLKQIEIEHPFLNAYQGHQAATKKMQFLEKMAHERLHPSFDVLKVTGRTSSFGEINSQNLPRDDRIRSCIIPSPGHVFIDADFKTVELATLAQACQTQFALSSKMAEAINAGQDLHRIVAAKVTGLPPEKVSSEDRQRAKAINFGKPGGLGDRALHDYAKNTYGVSLSPDEVAALSNAWIDAFPEMRDFLEDANFDLGIMLARTFELTPAAFHRHIGAESFRNEFGAAGSNNEPCPMLGWMLLKAVKENHPVTKAGRPYSSDELDFLWTRARERDHLFDDANAAAIEARQASPNLAYAVRQVADRFGVFTAAGRLRALASYTERHNTVFQGLAADGAKLALWKLWRQGYRIVNFIHDEVIIEVPAKSDLTLHADKVRNLMIEGMKEVVPDVRIEVELAVTDSWSKKATIAFAAPLVNTKP